MKKIWDIFDDEEEEKEEKKSSVWDIFEKPTATLAEPVETQFGIGAKAVGGATLPEPEPPTGVSQRMRGIGEIPKKYPFEGITVELSEANKKLSSLWWSELKTTEDKWKFLKHENWSPELQEADLEVQRLSEQASKMGVNTGDWIEYGVYMTFFAGMAASILPIIKGMPAEVLNKVKYKVGDKTVKGKELFDTIRRVAYADSPAYPDPSKFDKEVFAKVIEKGGVKGIGSLAKGITMPTIEPRFAFGTKLYAGLPIDEMVKSIVKTGKITQEIANGLKVMNPVDTGLVFQQLSIASPAIAAKVASEFVDLIPQKITKLPKADVTTEPVSEATIAKLEEVIGKRPVEITKEKVLEKVEALPAELEPLKYQEANQEVLIHKDWKNNSIRFDLEGAGDIFRELSKQYIQDFGYISEKIKRIEGTIKREGEAEIKRTLKINGEDTLKLIELWEAQPTKTPEQVLAKELNIAFAKGNIQETEAKIEQLKKLEQVTEGRSWLLKLPEAPEKIVQGLAPTEPKPEPKVEVKPEEPKIDLATPVQIKKAHAIANSKAMISEKGKVKPQYRAVAKGMTGKTSVKDMTPEEAEIFIDALDRLPEPKYKAGKLVAPTIPRTMKLTTEGFFQKEYGEPTPIWLLTDQTYYATKLGIKPLVEPFEKGKQEFDLEFRQSSRLVDKVVDKLNAIAKTSAFAKIKSKVKNIPTKAESKMAELINKHEATPPRLSEKEEDVFKYFRNLSKDIWRRENEVREKIDLPPIKYKQAYFRHTADVMAKEMLEGKYPFPQGIKYWGEKMVGKKIFNPMEFHRKLSDDLIDLWSKDIRAVTKGMLWSGLKEIYLAEPAKFLNEQLNAISKDLPEYKNLSPRDQAAYDQTRVMPSSTRKWLIDYVNQVLKGQETELDASLNRIVTKSGLKGIFDKVLSPFGRSVGRKPITNIFALGGRAIISGVMGWVPRQITRNSFQPVQNIALYGLKATIKAYLPASIDKNLVELMSESLFRKSYSGYEELPTDLMGKLEKVWLGPYGIVAVNNAKLGMKAAYWDTLDLIKNPKYKKNKWRDPRRTKDTPKDYLYPIEKEYLSKEMEFGASATQYQYIPMGMPGVFRYKALVPLTRLQSWWMNYFTKFTREAIHRGLKGRPSWSGEDGPTLPLSRRVNYIKYVILGGAILTALGYRRSFLLGVLPVYMSPAAQVALGFYNYATADEDWKRERALKQIYYSWKAFIPGSLAWRDFLAVWKGEKDLEEILFYGKKEEKKVAPKSDVWEEVEEEKIKETKSDIWDTFD